MSRHTLTALKPTHDVVVGWDRPMSTFFLQVIDMEASGEDDRVIFWLGGSFDEVKSAATLVDAVRSYAVIPASLQATLAAEQAASRLDPGAMSNATLDWREPTP